MVAVTLEGLKDKEGFKKAGVTLPAFDVAKVQEYSKDNPVWIHAGPGNIFRGFVASLQQTLLNEGLQQSGIQTVSFHGADLIDKIYKPHDSLTMEVTLLPDKSVELKVIGSVVAGYEVSGKRPDDCKTIREMFCKKSLQLFSYTITEKGYALKGIDGNYLPIVEEDFVNGPAKCHHAMSITAALLWERYQNGAYPIAVVSMDNCSHNGDKVKDAVLTIAKVWQEKGFVNKGFIDYLTDSSKVSFPWTMIDKITPRPDPEIVALLKDRGIIDMDPIKTERGTFIAPFVNAEKPQYLIVEDAFPNGRPPLEKAGVLFTDKQGVDLCERMKVTTCLNPLHTALAVYGCVLGYERISAEMDDADLVKLIKTLGYDEGLKVVDDPKILSETLKNYAKKGLDTGNLVALPLAIAGWVRYLLAIDDNGKEFELSDDPLIPELKKILLGIRFGDPSSVGDKLKPLLSNASIFGVDLYSIGLGSKIEAMVAEMIQGPGAVRKTLQMYLK